MEYLGLMAHERSQLKAYNGAGFSHTDFPFPLFRGREIVLPHGVNPFML
jgi:hypothetical protein